MEDIEQLSSLLNKVQFKSELDIVSYIIVLVMAACGTFLVAYLKQRGKRYATKEEFDELLEELRKNTEAVEEIKTKFSEKFWINQQIWVKKQEAYNSIFALLLNIRKYVSHQVSEFEEWSGINECHPYFQNMHPELDEKLKIKWESDKKEYEEKSKRPEHKKEAEALKINYEKSISKLFDLIEIHAIYLSDKIEPEIKELKKQLSTTHDYEEWDFHFDRISKSTSTAIDKIRDISKKELKIGI